MFQVGVPQVASMQQMQRLLEAAERRSHLDLGQTVFAMHAHRTLGRGRLHRRGHLGALVIVPELVYVAAQQTGTNFARGIEHCNANGHISYIRDNPCWGSVMCSYSATSTSCEHAAGDAAAPAAGGNRRSSLGTRCQ